MNILIIEDEPRAANRLERLIKKIVPECVVVGKPESIAKGVEALSSDLDIHLILSDIELGDGTSFEIFRQVETNIPIIFTTAYDQYAIDAFKVNGVDYLLKPIVEADLAKAIEKYKDNFSKKEPVSSTQSILEMLNQMQEHTHKTRFMVKVGAKLKSISVTEIAAFYSMAKGTFLMTKSQRNYSIDLTLDQLAQKLNPESFFKISRKQIVAIDAIDEILVHSNSRLLLKIKGLENQELVVAREKTKAFKIWLG